VPNPNKVSRNTFK